MAPVFLQKENNGCEYNHDIPGVTPSRLVFLFFLSVLHFVIFFEELGRRIWQMQIPLIRTVGK